MVPNLSRHPRRVDNFGFPVGASRRPSRSSRARSGAIRRDPRARWPRRVEVTPGEVISRGWSRLSAQWSAAGQRRNAVSDGSASLRLAVIELMRPRASAR